MGQSPVELAAMGDVQQAPERAQEVGVGADSSSPPHSSTPPFTTADFYIDESMPSSYTEAPELIRQLEDTNTLVALLQVQQAPQSMFSLSAAKGDVRNLIKCMHN